MIVRIYDEETINIVINSIDEFDEYINQEKRKLDSLKKNETTSKKN